MAATAIPGLDVTELGNDLQPYRNPRDALRKSGAKPGGIPGLDVTEIYDKPQRAVTAAEPYKPNFTTGRPDAASPTARPAPQIGGGPGAAVAPSTRPNFTLKPDLNTIDPPQRIGHTPPPVAQATVDPRVADSARARTAGIPGSQRFSGPPIPPGGAIPPAAAPDIAAPPAAAVGAAPEPVTRTGVVKNALSKVAGTATKGLGALAAPAVAVDALNSGASPGNIVAGAATGGALAGVPGAVAGGALAAGVGAAAALGDKFAAKNPEYENSMPGVGYDIMSGLPYAGEDNARAVSSERVKSAPFTQPAQAAAAPPPPAAPAVPSSAQTAIEQANAVRFPGAVDTAAAPAKTVVQSPQPDLAAINARTSEALRGSIDVARGLDQYGPGGGGAAGATSLGGESIAKRNAETTRSDQLDTLLNAAKSGNSRTRAAALQSFAQLAGQQSAQDSSLDIAQLRDGGDTARATIASSTARRGQDIGAENEAARNKTTLQGEQLRGKSALDVAGIQSDGRIEAALSREQRPQVVGGGQTVQDVGGLSTLVNQPQFLYDPNTRQFIPTPGAAQSAISTDPRALAIKNSASMTIEQKKAALAALGYK